MSTHHPPSFLFAHLNRPTQLQANDRSGAKHLNRSKRLWRAVGGAYRNPAPFLPRSVQGKQNPGPPPCSFPGSASHAPLVRTDQPIYSDSARAPLSRPRLNLSWPPGITPSNRALTFSNPAGLVIGRRAGQRWRWASVRSADWAARDADSNQGAVGASNGSRRAALRRRREARGFGVPQGFALSDTELKSVLRAAPSPLTQDTHPHD